MSTSNSEQHFRRFYQDIQNLILYYENPPEWSAEDALSFKRKILDAVRKVIEDPEGAGFIQNDIRETHCSSGLRAGRDSGSRGLPCNCSTCQDFDAHYEDAVNDLNGRVSRLKVDATPEIPKPKKAEKSVRLKENVKYCASLMTDDESVRFGEIGDYSLSNASTGDIIFETTPPVEGSGGDSHNHHQTMIETIQSSFDQNLQILRDKAIADIDSWNIFKKFKDIPVVQSKRIIVEALTSPDLGSCFSQDNATKPLSYVKLVQTVFPKLDPLKEKELTKYLAGSVRGNSFFRAFMNSLIEIHENFCVHCEEGVEL